MDLALAVMALATIAGVVRLLKPEWRSSRLFARGLFVTITTTLVFVLVKLFVHPLR